MAASFLFIPWPRPSGEFEPLLRPGWTLNYEMFFYVAFAVCMALRRRTAVVATAGLVLAAVALGGATRWPQPIAVEFIYGMAIALAAGEIKISRRAAVGLIAAGALALAVAAGMPAQSALRPLVWGVPAAAIVAGATLRRHELTARAWTPLILLGDASYALYLIHPFAFLPRVVAERAFGLPAGTWALHPYIYALVLICGTLPAAITLHLAVERPTIRAIRDRMKKACATATSG
jgi:peptidoglycan/LPS O-acetylase OafA/YrhL